jgi:small nuclear ribonucleoprotein (snRNP)-like protein
MPDPFVLSLLSIIVVAVVGAFLRRRSRDKCLMEFSDDQVTLEQTDGKNIWGRLRVEITGLELVYTSSHEDQGGHVEASYILYKHEFPKMQAIVRYFDELDDKGKKKRAKELRTAHHPSTLRRLWRKIANLFNTLRDSAMEGINLIIGRAKKSAGLGAVLTSQDKHVSQLKTELFTSTGTAFEPLLERHIGKRVVVEMVRNDQISEYAGFLKDYTAGFLSVMDVDCSPANGESPRKADLIIPRTLGVVRHLAE